MANCSKFFSLSILIFGELLVNATTSSRTSDKTLIYISKDIISEIIDQNTIYLDHFEIRKATTFISSFEVTLNCDVA